MRRPYPRLGLFFPGRGGKRGGGIPEASWRPRPPPQSTRLIPAFGSHTPIGHLSSLQLALALLQTCSFAILYPLPLCSPCGISLPPPSPPSLSLSRARARGGLFRHLANNVCILLMALQWVPPGKSCGCGSARLSLASLGVIKRHSPGRKPIARGLQAAERR